MDRVLFEDGRGNIYDENSEHVHVFEMEDDEDEYALEDVTNFDKYLDSKSPEKSTKANPSTSTEPAVPESEGKTNRLYRSYKSEVKNHFFFLLSKKNMSIRAAAKELQIPQSTAQSWKKKAEKAGDEEIETRASGSGRKAGRLPVLTEDHARFVIDFLDENPSSVLDDMMEGLTSQFPDLQIKKSSLHDFVTKKCNITLKRAHFYAVERNSPEKIEERFNWVKNQLQTDMDFISNCVFIDEAAFHINMKRSMAWSKKGERAVVVMPKTRAKTTTILGAISPYGVVNVRVRRPKVQAASKKEKLLVALHHLIRRLKVVL